MEWEGPIFEPIDPDSDGGLGGTSEELFGPLAVLLVGFAQYEVDQFRAFMIDMDADIVKIITCTKKMLSSTLEQSLDSPAPVFEQLPLGTKRAVFLSGMSGAEVQEVISAYNDSGLPPTVWAAAVPANYQRTISVLLEDIYGDHNLMANMEGKMRHGD
ncbi:g5931 [Coccomyxa elongata]